MNRVRITNALALLGALATTWVLARPRRPTPSPPVEPAMAAQPARLRLSDGEWAIADATGTAIPLRPYRRIVSTNFTTDRLLIELCEPTRILAVSRGGPQRKRDGYRYAGFATADGFGPAEALLALKPDLLLLNTIGSPGTVQRLRSTGVQVFDLGELRGVDSLSRAALAIGELLGAPERARHFVDGFTRRMRNVSANRPPGPRKRAVFLSLLGPTLMVGAADTPYHDILTAAGLEDAAAARYRGWPALSAEQVLALDPEIVVTREDARQSLCDYPGMNMLGPCRGKGRIVALPGDLLDEAGPGMLDTAELLYARAYDQP